MKLERANEASLITAPAQGVVKYQAIRYNATLVIDSPYYGPPSDKLEHAWADLLDSK